MWLEKRTNEQFSKKPWTHSTSTTGKTELKQPKFHPKTKDCLALTSVPLRYFKTESGRESKLLYFTDLIKCKLLLCFSNGLTDFVLRSKYWRSNSNRSNFSVFFSWKKTDNVHLLENPTLGVQRVQRKCLPSNLQCRHLNPFNSRWKIKILLEVAPSCGIARFFFTVCLQLLTSTQDLRNSLNVNQVLSRKFLKWQS